MKKNISLMVAVVWAVMVIAGIVWADGSSWETNIKRSTDAQTIDTVDAVTSITNTVTTSESLSDDIEGLGLAVVGTTAVELAFTGSTKTIYISSVTGNTGQIFIGKSDVDNAGANAIYVLNVNEKVEIPYNDGTNAMYVVSDTAGQSYIAGAILQ